MSDTPTVIGDRAGWVAVYTPWTEQTSWIPARPVRSTRSEAERDARHARAFIRTLTALADPPHVAVYRVKA